MVAITEDMVFNILTLSPNITLHMVLRPTMLPKVATKEDMGLGPVLVTRRIEMDTAPR